MKRIGIVEYHQHWDYFHDLQKMLTNDDAYVRSYEVMNIIGRKLDLLFVNSIQDTMRDVIHWLRFKKPCKSLLTIHNVNSVLKFPNLDIKKPIRSLDTLLTYLAFKFIVLPKFDAIIVLDKKLKDYIIKNKLYSKPIFVIPFKYHEKMYVNLFDTIVVPGRVEEHRRDYDAFLDYIKKEDSVVLLGEPIGEYGKKVIERCKQMNKQGYHIEFFEGRVPDSLYCSNLVNACTIVFPKVKESHGYGTTKEIYGQTKMVGAYFDAIKYGKKYIEGPPWIEIPIKYEDFSLENMKRYCKEEIIDRMVKK